MANFAASVLEAGQAIFLDQYIMKGEWRKPDYAALIMAEKGIVAAPNLKDLRTSPLRTVKAYLPVRQASTGKTARAHDHSGGFGDSKAVTLVWSSLVETFKVSMKQSDNNVLTGAQMFASQLRNAIYNLLSRSNAIFVASLLADKTQVNAGGANGTFNGSTFDYEVPATFESFFFQEVMTMMQKNLYAGNIVSLVDSKAFALAQRLINQGQGNQTNLGWQFQGFSVIPHTGTILSGNHKGSAITFGEATTVFQPWIPLKNRKPLDPNKIMDYVGDFGQMDIPELGVTFAIHAYSQRANTASSQGDVQDVVTEYEISIDWSYGSTPLSVADETPVFTSLCLNADVVA